MQSIAFVDDFMSTDSLANGRPWSDGMSRMYKNFIRAAGIEPRYCNFYTALAEAPFGRQSIYAFMGKEKEGVPYMKYFRRGNYLKAEYKHHLDKLWSQINALNPNVIVAAGDFAAFALAGAQETASIRGRTIEGNSAINRRKVIPTIGPRQLIQQWNNRPVLLSDLRKAERQSHFTEIRRPARTLYLEPSLDDIDWFIENHIKSAAYITCDIETKGRDITCVGFATDSEHALVIPFWDERKKDGNYWPNRNDEVQAWRKIRSIFEFNKPVIGQNFQYDIQYLWVELGIPALNAQHDTMYMHHAMYPELRKGLGFLGSLYSDEVPWKGMHKRPHADKAGKKGDDN